MFYLMQTANQNLILGFMPESLGLLIFGIMLIGLTVALRWALRKGERAAESKSHENVGSAKV